MERADSLLEATGLVMERIQCCTVKTMSSWACPRVALLNLGWFLGCVFFFSTHGASGSMWKLERFGPDSNLPEASGESMVLRGPPLRVIIDDPIPPPDRFLNSGGNVTLPM